MAKFMPLAEAVSENLKRGDTVAFEGFTHLIPLPPCMRQSARGLAI